MKNIVLYFSKSGENYYEEGLKVLEKGNCEKVAEYISEALNCPKVKVERKEEYPFGYEDCCEVAKKEKEVQARPQLKDFFFDVSEYDNVFVVYPCWWDTMPMPMFRQLDMLYITNKNIFPFCSHEGSGFGNSIKDLKVNYPQAIIREGMECRGYLTENKKEEIVAWAKKSAQ